MNERDWDMLINPALGDPLADIKEWMCPPFSQGDISRWYPCREKTLAQKNYKLVEGEYTETPIINPGHCGACDRDVDMVVVQEETHIRGNCPWCGAWIKWIPKEVSAGDEELFFGKWKGKTFREIPRDYLAWIRENAFEKLSKRAQNNLVKYLTGSEKIYG